MSFKFFKNQVDDAGTLSALNYKTEQAALSSRIAACELALQATEALRDNHQCDLRLLWAYCSFFETFIAMGQDTSAEALQQLFAKDEAPSASVLSLVPKAGT